MPNEIAFYLAAAVTLALAVAAMSLRHLVHCALCAAAAFAGLAVIYLQLDAEFVGFAQLLVYVGAIAILIVFAVLLTRGDEVSPRGGKPSRAWMAGAVIAALLLAGIAGPVLASPSLNRRAPPAAVAPGKSVGEVRRIGEELMTHYVLPLEMVGVLLTAALLGAVVIALREESDVNTQNSPPGANRAETKEAMSL